jgi:hypothetical protein
MEKLADFDGGVGVNETGEIQFLLGDHAVNGLPIEQNQSLVVAQFDLGEVEEILGSVRALAGNQSDLRRGSLGRFLTGEPGNWLQ